jgi:hypothetical protein
MRSSDGLTLLSSTNSAREEIEKWENVSVYGLTFDREDQIFTDHIELCLIALMSHDVWQRFYVGKLDEHSAQFL